MFRKRKGRKRRHSGEAATVGLIDPALEQGGKWDVNLGDQIISDAVSYILEELCAFKIAGRFPSLRKLEKRELRILKNCDYVIVGGTNLLSSNMNRYRQWVIDLWDTFHLKDVILLGVGWWQYQPDPNVYTRILVRRILNRRKFHSVRDNYTKKQLARVGLRNVLNTSCPSMWGISQEIQEGIPTEKAEDVVFTLTYYNKGREHDKSLLELLKQYYRKVYFWPQGDKDEEYVRELGSNIEALPFDLAEYDRLLVAHDDIDYIGTRLHAGIRAIQKGKRALILTIDNRAAEISRDTNLNTIDRRRLADIEKWIFSDHKTDIRLPDRSIKKWVRQFLE